jgi:hypothetical protein
MIEKVYKPEKSYSVYEYKFKGLTDKFKVEELFRVDEYPKKNL